jgi:hypothetical protein
MFSLLKRQGTRAYLQEASLFSLGSQANTQNFDSNADFLAAYASY